MTSAIEAIKVQCLLSQRVKNSKAYHEKHQ
jgi:hypothetical protein